MEARSTNSGLRLQGRIDTKVHDEADLREAADGDYDSLSKREKLELADRICRDMVNSLKRIAMVENRV